MYFEKEKFLEILKETVPFKTVMQRKKRALIKWEEFYDKRSQLDYSIMMWKDWYKLGAYYLKKGDFEKNNTTYNEAIKCFEKIKIPDQAKIYLRNAYSGLAEAYEKLGDLKKSEEYRQKSKQYDKEI